MKHAAVIGVAAYIGIASLGYAAEGLANDEGPFVGGVFSRAVGQAPTPQPESKDRVPREDPARLVDANGQSNELIVAFRYDEVGLIVNAAEIAQGRSRGDFERAVVEAVEKQDSITKQALHGASGARHLTEGMRLSQEDRALLAVDDPREKLEQYIVVSYPTIEAAQGAMEALERHPSVSYVANNRRLNFASVDPYFDVDQSAPNAARYQWGLHAMSFPAAWGVTKGHGYVGAADKGLPVEQVRMPSGNTRNKTVSVHEDLQKNYRLQFTYYPSYWGGGDEFHGSHVMGIIGATLDNGRGLAGGCPDCSLVMAGGYYHDEMALAIMSLLDRGVQVVNYSVAEVPPAGQPEFSCATFAPMCNAISLADKRDVLIVASSGNYSRNVPGFPANQPSVLSVGGVQNISVAYPSSWEPWYSYMPDNKFDVYQTYVGTNAPGINGVLAPAKSIISTVPMGVSEFLCVRRSERLFHGAAARSV